jgi:serine/threonine protein phosphatase 1
MLDYLFTQEKINEKDQLIFTGDYIDRGDNSPGVVQRLIDLRKELPKTIFLRGNHEAMFLGHLRLPGGLFGSDFLHNGGNATLKQYKDIPVSHTFFIQNTNLVVETDDYYFVHAGFNQFFPIEEQFYEDLIWIREPFIYGNFDYGKTVIHGHTITNQLIFLNSNQINIDTGCYKKGFLTCLNLSSFEAYVVNSKDKNVYVHDSNSLIEGVKIWI